MEVEHESLEDGFDICRRDAYDTVSACESS
jgi:hypothetical protein